MDSEDRILKTGLGKNWDLTPQWCIAECLKKNFALAGVQAAIDCFCDSVDPSLSYLAPDKDCNKPCEGDSTQMCGGNWRMNIYSTGKHQMLLIEY